MGNGNLILTRKKDEEFVVYVKRHERQCLADIFQHADRDDIIHLVNSVIKIKIIDIQGGQVKVLFNAPSHIAIQRLEIHTPIEEVKPDTDKAKAKSLEIHTPIKEVKPAGHKRNPLQKLWDKVKKCA